MQENKQIKSNFKSILKRETWMFFYQESMHGKQLIAWILADTVKILGLCFVWMAAMKSSGSSDVGYIVSYYLLVLLEGRLMGDITPWNGVANILNGKFSNYLLKPVSYLTSYLGNNIGSNLFRLLVSIPAFIVGVLITEHLGLWIVRFDPELIVLSLAAVIIGFLINFLMGNIFALIAFYNKNMEGMRIFYFNIAAFLSGEYAPLIMLPLSALYFVQLLPFRYTLSFPIEILLGRITNYELTFGFAVALGWLVILLFMFIYFYNKAIKRYAAEGI